MSVQLTLPRIDGATTEQQLRQLRSYLYQMTEQLQFALNHLNAENFDTATKELIVSGGSSLPGGMTPEQNQFYNELKALIIKTAHTVEAYYEEITRTLEYEYVAQSEFGIFKEYAQSELRQNADNLTQYYGKTTELESNLQGVETEFNDYVANTNAYIRTGFLYENEQGVPIYGVEIGQVTKQEIDGEEVIVTAGMISRFANNRLSFYQDEAEVAYISNQRLYITDAEITGVLVVGSGKTGAYTVLPMGNGHVLHVIND